MEQLHILSIAPYRILPPTSGGHLGIASLHDYLGKICDDNLLSTLDNTPDPKYAFNLIPYFTVGVQRYIPYFGVSGLVNVARQHKIEALYCDHPYMAPTVNAVAKRLKVPWYLRSHNIESERFRTYGKKWWPIMRLFEGAMMRKANGVLLITPEDMEWAKKHYHLKNEKCHLIPYGTILDKAPLGHTEAKKKVAAQLGLRDDIPWLYFLGAMDFYPNVQAVEFILNEIMPRLNFHRIEYQVLIAGKGLNEQLKEQISNTPGIVYTGFIPDLNDFLLACDVMLNPVILGGGIKTKAVEALGYNKIVISTKSGAAGLVPSACGRNLYITPDYDWEDYTNALIEGMSATPNIPNEFYEVYYWGNIAKKISMIIREEIGK